MSDVKDLIAKANKGDIDAQRQIDEMTEQPYGTYAKALIDFQGIVEAAHRGETNAMTALGQAYYTGMGGLDVDIKQAQAWLERAASKSSEAMWHLGQIHAMQYDEYGLGLDMMKRALEMGPIPNMTDEEIKISIEVVALLARTKDKYGVQGENS